jgi:hypothetical protein
MHAYTLRYCIHPHPSEQQQQPAASYSNNKHATSKAVSQPTPRLSHQLTNATDTAMRRHQPCFELNKPQAIGVDG